MLGRRYPPDQRTDRTVREDLIWLCETVFHPGECLSLRDPSSYFCVLLLLFLFSRFISFTASDMSAKSSVPNDILPILWLHVFSCLMHTGLPSHTLLSTKKNLIYNRKITPVFWITSWRNIARSRNTSESDVMVVVFLPFYGTKFSSIGEESMRR